MKLLLWLCLFFELDQGCMVQKVKVENANIVEEDVVVKEVVLGEEVCVVGEVGDFYIVKVGAQSGKISKKYLWPARQKSRNPFNNFLDNLKPSNQGIK